MIRCAFEIREPSESILPKLVKMPDQPWVEIGGLVSEGPMDKQAIRVLASMVLSVVGRKKIFLFCGAHHVRLWRRFGHIIASGMNIDHANDVVMEVEVDKVLQRLGEGKI